MARLIARGGKEEGRSLNARREKGKGDLYIERTYVDSNNSRAISLPHLTVSINSDMVLGSPFVILGFVFGFHSMRYIIGE